MGGYLYLISAQALGGPPSPSLPNHLYLFQITYTYQTPHELDYKDFNHLHNVQNLFSREAE